MTLPQLERHRFGAADILRGKLDTSEFKQYKHGLMDDLLTGRVPLTHLVPESNL